MSDISLLGLVADWQQSLFPFSGNCIVFIHRNMVIDLVKWQPDNEIPWYDASNSLVIMGQSQVVIANTVYW